MYARPFLVNRGRAFPTGSPGTINSTTFFTRLSQGTGSPMPCFLASPDFAFPRLSVAILISASPPLHASMPLHSSAPRCYASAYLCYSFTFQIFSIQVLSILLHLSSFRIDALPWPFHSSLFFSDASRLEATPCSAVAIRVHALPNPLYSSRHFALLCLFVASPFNTSLRLYTSCLSYSLTDRFFALLLPIQSMLGYSPAVSFFSSLCCRITMACYTIPLFSIPFLCFMVRCISSPEPPRVTLFNAAACPSTPTGF